MAYKPRNVKREYKYNIGDRFTDKDRDIEIVERKMKIEYTKSHGKKIPVHIRWYRVKCHICGWDGYWIKQDRFYCKFKYQCACCSGHAVVPGLNDIATTHPNKVKYFANKKEAQKYTYGTKAKVLCKCPECGDMRLRLIQELIKEEKYSCAKCGDGFSIPERFIYNILQKYNIEFIHQLSKKTYKWCEDYFYDFYLPKTNTIIEVNGIQHYVSKFYTDVEKQIEIDIRKEYIAKNNGITNYIVIPAIYSNLDCLTSSILESNLFDVLQMNPNSIDFAKCYENTCSSLVKIVCEDYNNNPNQTISGMAKKYNLDRQTIRKYLKRGTSIGWCHYTKQDMKEHLSRVLKESGKCHGEPVEIFKNEESLGVFESARDLSRQSKELFGVKLCDSSINQVCRGHYKRHKGFSFRRLTKDEYSKRISSLSTN